MGFGKRKVVKKVEENVDDSDKVAEDNIAVYSSIDDALVSDTIVNNTDVCIGSDKKVVSRLDRFIKKREKVEKKINVNMFGLTKEEKLELYINNVKALYSNIPEFWLKKDIEGFKKKIGLKK